MAKRPPPFRAEIHKNGPPRLALSREEAALALGMSLDSFERYVQAEVRLVRCGRLRLVPVRELEAWLVKNAERPVAEEIGCG